MKLIHGHGYNDGKYPTKINGIRLPQYEMWLGMLRRCYSPIDSDKNKFKSYCECTASHNFKSYSYFYEWYESNIPNNSDKFFLDKDLIFKGNTVYGEDYCLLLPREVNNAIILSKWKRGKYLIGVTVKKNRRKFSAQISINGKNKTIGGFDTEIEAYHAYKKSKEAYLKGLAEKYSNSLTLNAITALQNYKVDIMD